MGAPVHVSLQSCWSESIRPWLEAWGELVATILFSVAIAGAAFWQAHILRTMKDIERGREEARFDVHSVEACITENGLLLEMQMGNAGGAASAVKSAVLKHQDMDFFVQELRDPEVPGLGTPKLLQFQNHPKIIEPRSSSGHVIESGKATKRVFQVFTEGVGSAWLPDKGDEISLQPIRGPASRIKLSRRVPISWHQGEGRMLHAVAMDYNEPDEEWNHEGLTFLYEFDAL